MLDSTVMKPGVCDSRPHAIKLNSVTSIFILPKSLSLNTH
jgi:hypothetical protein